MMQNEWEALGEAEAAFAPEGEWEDESEGEWEDESEGEWESEFGAAASPGIGGRLAASVALDAARSILSNAGGAPGAYAASLLPNREWEGELEGEWEGESEGEWESEYELNPTRKVYLDAMLEHMAHEAVHAESEDEAVESFLPLVPMLAGKILPLAAKVGPRLAGKIIPRLARNVTRVSPSLSKGISSIARKLYRDPGTRGLLRAVPSIAQRTMRRIAHQAAVGRPITAKSALRTLAQQTYRVLSHPGARSRALRRHRGMDRRYHGSTGIPAGATGGIGMGRARGVSGWPGGMGGSVPMGAAPRPMPTRRPGVCLSCGARAVYPVSGGRLRGRCVCSRCACTA
ncbi:hypothetical protein [Paraburkholderia sp. PGU19]|uniref:hypothetical protein n=1 Tax=Paraburkholderia sp. PGU19 TaxID=2735434 RepID=UPI0015DBA6EF|nr:hypothetical protein [Paraburkholderia sp. PGU19]